MIRFVVYLHRENVKLCTVIEPDFYRRVGSPEELGCSEALLSDRNHIVLFAES